MRPTEPSKRRRILAGLLSLAIGAALWLPAAHLVFPADPGPMLAKRGLDPRARALAHRLVGSVREPGKRGNPIGAVDRVNPEWGLMTRSFLAWSLAEMALRDPGRKEALLADLDAVLGETLRMEKEEGFQRFLLPYGRSGGWVARPARSLFVDAEIALSLGLRCLVSDRADVRSALAGRTEGIARRLEAAPAHLLESYPDECWLFDHATALAALRVADAVLGTDHRALCARWVAAAKARCVERRTGLLGSSFSTDGKTLEGPEGSSILWSAHCLRIVDPSFARGQYEAARRELHRTLLGFGYAREWPASLESAMDVDSGAVLPVLGASPSASGLALIAAGSFGDADTARTLLRSLGLAAFPVREGEDLRFAAGNAMGDAVLLYALVQGPAWDEVLRRAGR